MARGERVLKVTIVGDASNVQRAFGQVDQAGEQTQSKLGGVARKIGGAFAGLALGRALHGASQDFAKFEDLASGAASAVGRSIEEMGEIAKGFRFVPPTIAAQGLRDLLQIQKGYGVTGDEAIKSAKKQLEWAEAAAVVTGIPVEEIVTGIAAAYRGEYDALQRVIPRINAANVEQEALRMTGKKHAKELTDLEKAMAVQNIVLQDQNGYVKQLNDNTGTQAAKQKEARAEAERARIEMGEKMAPVVAKVTTLVGGLASTFADMPGSVQTAVIAFVGLAIVANTVLVPAIGAVGAALSFLAAHPVVAIVIAIGLLVAALITAWQHSETFRDVVVGVFRFVVDKVLAAVEWLMRGLATAFSWVPGLGDQLRNAAEAVEGFRDRMNTALDNIKTGKLAEDLKEIEAILNRNPAINQVIAREGTLRGAMGLEPRQHGGPVFPGRRYLVGEDGPELLTLGRSSPPGYVTPSSGAPPSVTNNIMVYPETNADAHDIAREIAWSMRTGI